MGDEQMFEKDVEESKPEEEKEEKE